MEVEQPQILNESQQQYHQLMCGQLGGLPPYKKAVLQPFALDKQPTQYYAVKPEYTSIISRRKGSLVIKILHCIIIELGCLKNTTVDSVEDYKKSKSILRGSRHIYQKYLDAFAGHLFGCYDGDPVKYASENPNFSTKISKGDPNPFHPKKGCSRCQHQRQPLSNHQDEEPPLNTDVDI